MHADQLDVGVELVRRLVDAQFPEWAGLPLEPVASGGTVNALFRLGDDLVVRLPVREEWEESLVLEREWLPRLAPQLPVAVPVPVAQGLPGDGYPCAWSVYEWLPGKDATVSALEDPMSQLASFIRALQVVDSEGGPPGRGVPLATRDAAFSSYLEKLPVDLDRERLAAEWQRALSAPEWRGPPLWSHGDLDARNVLVLRGRLSAVLDWAAAGVGDPACDVMVAWKLVPAGERDAFRDELAVDDATWERARGWLVSQAVIALGYYTEETNPVFVAEARRWLAELGLDAR